MGGGVDVVARAMSGVARLRSLSTPESFHPKH
jgi:hypothetical protein